MTDDRLPGVTIEEDGLHIELKDGTVVKPHLIVDGESTKFSHVEDGAYACYDSESGVQTTLSFDTVDDE
jgi:hypothetical protein